MTSSSPSPNPSSPITAEDYHEAQMATWELEWRRCSQDPWHFVKTHCRTLDEATERDWDNPVDTAEVQDCIRPFPERCYPYLRRLTDFWLAEKLLAILKSRQVMVSWLMVCLYLWAAMFHKGVRAFLQSKKQKDANALLARAAFVFRQLPAWMQERAGADITATEIRFPKIHSEIWAIPEGEDVIRGYTLTLWFSDETAAQKNCKDAYKAARHSLGKGARACFVTSAKPGWFHKVHTDTLESPVAPKPVEKYEVCEGLTFHRNASNRFACLFLHYTADPDKRSAEWLSEAKAGVSAADWKQEMEGDFEAKAGNPAIPEFEHYQTQLTVPETWRPPAGWSVFITSDYGPSASPHATYFHATGPDGVTVTFGEIYGVAALGDHLAKVKAHPDFKRAYAYILDRSCFRDDQQHSVTVEGQTRHMVRSVAELHHDHGVYPIPAAVVPDTVKIEAIYKHWLPLFHSSPAQVALGLNKKPTWLISRVCVSLLRELPGIRWKEVPDHLIEVQNPSQKLIDKDNHGFDALTYAMLHRVDVPVTVPEPEPREVAIENHRKKLREEHFERQAKMARDDRGETGAAPNYWDADD